MDDERRKRDELGSAPTTPAPPTVTPAPDATLDMPASDQVAAESNELTRPGAAIGHFVVERRLGEGGMGVVLACKDADLGRAVAVKLVRTDAEHPAYRARLLREAQAMARLEHPNVVKVYEVGSERGRLFIAMELVDGQTLSAWLREPRPWRDALDMFLQVGEGLAAVHAAGLVHRDFKPDNVLVDRSSHARVADFGLARIEEGAAAQPLTKTGALMGTPGYMAPEQQFGADVDARADQYSYCVALREALGGRPLDDTRWAMVPKDIRAAITRGLSYDPGERFASMQELLATLRAVRAPMTEPRWVIALLAVAVLGTVSGILVYFKRDKPATHASLVRDAMPAKLDEPLPADAGRDDRTVVEAPPAPPVDASSDAPVRVAAKHHDAGSVVEDAAQVAAAPPGLNVQIPTSKHLPESKVGHPGHLPIVRNAVKDLGYDGFDASVSADVLEKTLESATGADKGIAQVKLGMWKRKAGDCAVASALWTEASKLLKPMEETDESKWAARAYEGRAICALGAGKADDAFDLVTHAWVHGNRDEVQLLMGFIKFEQGEKDLAYGSLLVSERAQNAKVQAALKAWLDGMGFTLR